MAALAHAAYFDEPLAAARRYHASAEFAAVRRMIPASPGRALDLGAGNGILSWALAREGWAVTAVEPDPSILVGAGAIRAMSEQSGTPIEVIEAEACSFDATGSGFAEVFIDDMHTLVRPAKSDGTIDEPVL
ncbi:MULTISPECIES: class I SAM-dependent methyltransferase [unclassified Aurantimonas]|uniref:class I SAM-dependent methyltransferase n=1 Tax=unclassified Aurantimonas TaxID=2638230 RepID=UPI002E19CC7C|nr:MULTISPECIES: hypothetical protein [unclassified Aurantimonas]MEC5293725.1 hypothetical protein [Aurantimonas sp. C2-3-R2]MEC5414771.1 hypothetical protein [Aurantimonas sp. C2-4-R8]